jgi:xanthine dehydrogenase accessory factor
MKRLVVIKGAGDIATGIAHRLFRSGFRVVMTDLPRPTAIRRTVAFATAIFEGGVEVEGVEAVCTDPAGALEAVESRRIPVAVDPTGLTVKTLKPWAVVDAILAKKNLGTRLNDAPVVIGVGPGFTAGLDVHMVVETKRGHYLGRVITDGQAFPSTGEPGMIEGFTHERILRAPCEGVFRAVRKIAESAAAGDILAYVDGQPVTAQISGVIRGLLHDGLQVHSRMKIGDIDPRGLTEYCFTISDKARAVAGGVLEALLMRYDE